MVFLQIITVMVTLTLAEHHRALGRSLVASANHDDTVAVINVKDDVTLKMRKINLGDLTKELNPNYLPRPWDKKMFVKLKRIALKAQPRLRSANGNDDDNSILIFNSLPTACNADGTKSYDITICNVHGICQVFTFRTKVRECMPS